MATANPFDFLGDFDNDDPLQLIAAQQPKMEQKKALAPTQSPAQQPAARLPSKPLPPAQTVREAKTEAGHGGGHGGGRGHGSGFNRESANNENSFGSSGFPGGQGATEEADIGKPSERRGGYGGPHGSYRGGRRGGFSDGEEAAEGERPRRPFERCSGTGRGNEIKREGSGCGNWGTPADELAQVTEEVINEVEKNQDAEKPSGEDTTDSNKENPVNEAEEKEPEDKEMTLEEYEKVRKGKRKAFAALGTEERKVSNKEGNDDIFIKLGSHKDKRKEYDEKEEKTKKEMFERLSTEASSVGNDSFSSTAVDEYHIFYQTVSSRNKKGRVYGLSSQANQSYSVASSSTSSNSYGSMSHDLEQMSHDLEQMRLMLTQISEELHFLRNENVQLRQWQQEMIAWQDQVNKMMSVILKQSIISAGSSTDPLDGDPFCDDDGNKGDVEQNAGHKREDSKEQE